MVSASDWNGCQNLTAMHESGTDGGPSLRPNDRTSWVSFISVAIEIDGKHHYQVGNKKSCDENIGLSRLLGRRRWR
jgi:hypothetical protein